MTTLDDHTLHQFLAQFPSDIRDLVLKTRSLICTVMPETIEQLDPAIHMIAFGTDRTYKGLICSITIFKTYINIMLAQGASLPDPDGLLKGTGKKARHLRIENQADLADLGVRRMLETARLRHSQEPG